MVQTELTSEQRQTATWSEIDWTATEAVVKRLQGRIYRAAAAGNGRQVKKPGDREWVDVFSAAGSRVTKVACPKGGADRPVPVLP